jgi:hypothetical protein
MWLGLFGLVVALGILSLTIRYRQRIPPPERLQPEKHPGYIMCLTPWVEQQSQNPEFSLQCIYTRADGRQFVVDDYPYDDTQSLSVIGQDGRVRGHRSRRPKGKSRW